MYKIITFIACLISLTSLSAASAKYLGFYDVNDPNDIAGWGNIAFSTDFDSFIPSAGKLGVKVLFAVESTFFVPFTGTSPRQLRDDFKSRWSDVAKKIRPFYENGTIIGVFMGDELMWTGLTPEDLAKAADLVRETYGDAIIWENDTVPVWKNDVDQFGNHLNLTTYPASISIASLDMYHNLGPDPDFVKQQVIPKYQQYVYPKLNAEQKIFTLPGSFSSTLNDKCDAACYDKMCSLDAYAFADWAAHDNRVAGHFPWHFEDNFCPECLKAKDEIGTIHMNVTLKAWQEIGRAMSF